MKKILLAFFAGACAFQAFSQSTNILKDDKLMLAELQKEKYDVDTNAQAVVLYKKITADMYNGVYNYSVDFIAKILSDEAASDLSLVNVTKYDRTTVSISGETYNLENGKVVKQELDKTEVLKDKFIRGIDIMKFNMPSVKKGSIIHYTYKTNQINFISIPDQYLQLSYPILEESYEIKLASYLTCKRIERINIPLVNAKYESVLDTCQACVYSQQYGSNDGAYYKWVRRNVPAFKQEPMMGSGENYKERIRIQVESILLNGKNISFFDNWDNYEKKFIYNQLDGYGQVFKGNGFLGDEVKALIAGKKTDEEKAKAIYIFVRDSFNVKYTNRDFGLRAILNSRTGSEKEINLLLVAMLRKAGLKCSPMFLSPKPQERLNPIFPDERNSSVILAALEIDKKSVYLDATKKRLPYGLVLPDNYNGYARLVDEYSKGIEMDPNMIADKSITVSTIKPGDKPNQLLIKIDNKMGAYEAYQFREKMINDTAEIRKSITKMMKEDHGSFKLTDVKVENLENPDAPLKLHIEASWDLDANIKTIYFNPFMDKFMDKNPFSSPTRTNPIEMDYQEEKTYLLNMQLPQGYIVDDYPKSSVFKLNEKGDILLQNAYAYDVQSNTVSVRCSLKTNECTYPTSAYDGIKALYNKCIEAQNEKIVIKKTELK